MKKIAVALSVLMLLLAGFFVWVNIDTGVLQDASHIRAEVASLSPQAVKVDGVKLQKQPDGFTCAATTVSVVVAFCTGKDMTTAILQEKYGPRAGNKTEEFVDMLTRELPDYAAAYRSGLSDGDLVKAIHQQLTSGTPVPVFFGAENPYNKPLYDFHASVVTGIDLAEQRVDIANVYGYEEHISLAEFLNRMSYRGARNYPMVQRVVAKLGLQKKNAIVELIRK